MKVRIRTIIILSYVLIILLFSLGIVFIINGYILNEVTGDHIRFAENGVKNLNEQNKELTEKYMLDLGKVFVTVSATDSSKIISFILEDTDYKTCKALKQDKKLQEIVYEPITLHGEEIGYTDLLDEDGTILLHNMRHLEGQNIYKWRNKFPELCKIFENAVKNKQSSGYYHFWDSDGDEIVEKYMAVANVPNSKFYLCSYMNLSVIFKPINDAYHREEHEHTEAIRADIENHAIDLSRAIQNVSMGFILLLSGFCGMLALWIAHKITRPISQLSSAVKLIGKGQFETEVPTKGSLEIAELASAFNNLGKQLNEYMENLKQEIKVREVLEGELKIARNIQVSILQENSLQDPREEIELFATLYPAKDVAGDFYDFFYLDEQKRDVLAVLVADVSGKGIYAAIFMAMAKTLLKNLCLLYPDDPSVVLKKANNLFINSESMFVTLFLGYYKIETGELMYANGGHHNALCLKEDGSYHEFGVFNDALLGLFPDNDYHLGQEQIKTGDVLFLYTDGMTEAINPDREEFGDERLKKNLVNYRENELELMCQKIFNDVKEYEAGSRFDDITMLALKRIL